MDDELKERIRRAQGGDSAAMEWLLIKYEPLLRKHVRLLHRRLVWTHSCLDVDDLIQEVRLIMIELTGAFQLERGVPFGFYLMVKLGWRSTNFVRQEQMRVRRELVYDHHVLQEVLANDERLSVHPPEDGVMIGMGVGRLTDQQRRVFLLHNVQGKSTSEVGALLGLTAREIRRVRGRALKRLREELKGA